MKLSYLGATIEITPEELNQLTVGQVKALLGKLKQIGAKAHDVAHKVTKKGCRIK